MRGSKIWGRAPPHNGLLSGVQTSADGLGAAVGLLGYDIERSHGVGRVVRGSSMKSQRSQRRGDPGGQSSRGGQGDRGPGHVRLDALVGLWDTHTRVFGGLGTRPVEVDGSVEKSWVLGGRFIREDLAGISNRDRPYMGLGFVGYDTARRLYQSVWMSTGGTGMVVAAGTAEDGGDGGVILTLIGDEVEAESGRLRRFRAVLFIESRDRHVLTQTYVGPDGTYGPGFEIVYTRSEADPGR